MTPFSVTPCSSSFSREQCSAKKKKSLSFLAVKHAAFHLMGSSLAAG